ETSGLPGRDQRAVAAEAVSALAEPLREQDQVLVVVGRRIAVEAALAGGRDARFQQAPPFRRRDRDQGGIEARRALSLALQRPRIQALRELAGLLQRGEQARRDAVELRVALRHHADPERHADGVVARDAALHGV